jgi:ABC-type hemin transport system ATPase subunit
VKNIITTLVMQVVVLEAGRVLEIGHADDLLKSDKVRSLFGRESGVLSLWVWSCLVGCP